MKRLKNIIKGIIPLMILGAILFTSCDSSELVSDQPDLPSTEQFAAKQMAEAGDMDKAGLDLSNAMTIDEVNQFLAASDANIRVAYAETFTNISAENQAEGQIIFANDRTLRLEAQWVPDDSRRNATGNALTHQNWGLFMEANYYNPLPIIDPTDAINSSLDTWESTPGNNKLDIIQLPNTPYNISGNNSYVLGLYGLLPFGDALAADISTVGFLPGNVFDIVLGSGASDGVLGVTFTFVWVENGEPTDVNNDGYADVALKEVWYNDAFPWTDDPENEPFVDIESVALHENGHALGFGHFGKLSITGLKSGNLKLHASPRAVMNASYLEDQRELYGTDKASFKSIYGDHPKD